MLLLLDASHWGTLAGMLLKPTPSVALRPAQRSFSTPARVLVAACNAPGREQAAGPQSGRPGSTPVPALPHATHGMQQQQQQPSAAIAALAAPLMVQQIQRGLKKLALLARRARLRELLFGWVSAVRAAAAQAPTDVGRR